jgi:hypothetical protein
MLLSMLCGSAQVIISPVPSSTTITSDCQSDLNICQGKDGNSPATLGNVSSTGDPLLSAIIVLSTAISSLLLATLISSLVSTKALFFLSAMMSSFALESSTPTSFVTLLLFLTSTLRNYQLGNNVTDETVTLSPKCLPSPRRSPL